MRIRSLAPVLIVEDNAETREVLRRLLALRGYTTVTADDGLDALSYLRRGGETAVIVLDMRMPNMDGWEFRRALADDVRFRDIPIVIYSCDPAAARERGIVGFVRKATADPGVLLDLVQQAAERSH